MTEQIGQELAEPMPSTHQLAADIVAAATQVADRFLLGCGRTNLCQQIRTKQLGQLAGVAPVRLDPLARLARDQRRRDDLALDARLRRVRCSPKPQGPAS